MEHMTWWAYVQQAAAESNANIARRIGVTPSSISRWGRGSLPDPEQAAAFARAYGRPVLEAFIAAGFLTAEEAGEKPSAPPSLASLGDDELLEEIRRRMQGGSSDGRQPEAEKRIQRGGDRADVTPNVNQDDVGLAARHTRSRGKQLRAEMDAAGEESQDMGEY